MGARRLARERALQALYQIDQNPNLGSSAALDAAWTTDDDPEGKDPTVRSFAQELVDGVQKHGASIDALIEKHSHNWRLDRIRENDVVFVRETPDPSAPATTRVLSLRTQDELKQDIRTGIRGTRPDEASGSYDDDDRPAKPKAPPAPKPKN